jgi:hypothetical protein
VRTGDGPTWHAATTFFHAYFIIDLAGAVGGAADQRLGSGVDATIVAAARVEPPSSDL